VSNIVEYDKIEAALVELSEKYGEVPDVTTKEGYTLCKANAKAVGKYRIELEKKRKEIKGPALQKCKDIDSEAKRIADELAKIEQPLADAYKAIDEEKKKREAERIANIESSIDSMRGFENLALSGTSEEISEWIEQLEEIDCTQGFDEFTQEALKVRNKALEFLAVQLESTIAKEIEQERVEKERAELEALRAEKQAMQAKLDEAARIEREKAEAEQAAEREEQRRIEMEKRIAEEKEAAEQKAIEDERKRAEAKKLQEEEEAKAREANKKHKAKINNEALNCFVDAGLSKGDAKKAVEAIAKGEVENVKIFY
jgi:hypothetical protein